MIGTSKQLPYVVLGIITHNNRGGEKYAFGNAGELTNPAVPCAAEF